MADPVFNTATANPFGLTNVGASASPTFVDIDNDGDLDAFVGNKEGETWFYRNSGTASSAAFAAADTSGAFGLTDVGSNASPVFVDIDGDGDLDAFVSNLLGVTRFYENTAASGATTPQFASPSTNPFGLSAVGYYNSPTFDDIDNDGDLDAFVGVDSGVTWFYENTGSASSADFTLQAANLFGLIDVGSNASPTLVDIDGDGDLDAFIGNSAGNTFYFQNTGSDSSAAFVYPVTSGAFGLTDAGSNASPTFVDIDDDGDLDAFIGDKSGNVQFFLNTPPPVAGVTLTQTGGTAVTEGGSTDSYTLVLNTAPTHDVIITLDYTNNQIAADVATLTFTTANWDTPQTVTLTAANDSVNEGTHSGVIKHSVTSVDGDYNGSEIADLSVTITDNDTPAAATNFLTPETNPFGLTDVGSYSSPTFVDIDGDGDLDAFVGDNDGETWFYRNNGTASSAAFAEPTTNPFSLTDVGFDASPTFVDIDNDGDLDAFVGNNSGETWFYQNTGSASNAVLAAPTINPFGLTDVGTLANPTFVDIDADGDLDAFIGNGQNGNTLFYENTATSGATTPLFSSPSTNPFGLTDVGYFTSPTFVDIDGDGDLDAFIGEYIEGDTWFYRNDGTASSAAFSSPTINPFGLTQVAPYVSPTFVDIDADGDLDAFVGDESGNVQFFLNAPPPPPPGVTLTQTGGTAVTEGGSTDSYTLVLNTAPTDDVTITLDDTNNQIAADVTTLTFTTTNWDTPQTVTLTAVNDSVNEGTHNGVIKHSVTSVDGDYNGGEIADLSVTITDNDTPPVAGFGNVLTVGADDYAIYALATSPWTTLDISSGGSAITLAAWVRPDYTDGTADGAWEIMSIADTSSATPDGDNATDYLGFRIDAESKKLKIGIDNGNAWTAVDSTHAIADGVWSHVAAVINGNSVTFYINGVASGGGTLDERELDGIDNLTIGALNLAGGTDEIVTNENKFKGSIDEVQAWNAALTAEQVQSWRLAVPDGNEVNLSGVWRFGESSGMTSADGSSNARTATLEGGPGLGSGYGVITVSTIEDTAITLPNLPEYDADNASVTFSLVDNDSGAAVLTDPATGAITYTPAANVNGIRTFTYKVNDGNADSATQTVNVNITAVSDAPVITSNGGGANAAVNAAENQTAVTTVTATDADAGQTVTFSLSGGVDQAKFSINASTGVLSFASAPDFEAPTDTGTNNTYVVDVTANDGNSGTDVQTITVTVTDVGEGGGGDPPAPPPVVPPVVPPVTTATVDGVVVSSTTTNTSTNVTDPVTGEVTTVSTQTVTTTVPIVTDTRQEENAATPQADIPLATNTGGDALLTASLPVGIGLTSAAVTGSSGSATGQTLRDLLIAAAEPRSEQSAFGSILGQGIDSFVPGVRDEAQVTVRTITFQIAPAQPNDSGSPTTPAAPAAPIVITGASGTGEQNSAHPDRQEALVIDVRNLPSGTVLQLDSVEFAIIIGATRVTGGNGRNFAVGDDAVQYMVLGEDDDVLRGGGGDDTVASRGGDDQLFGDEGNDWVVGGIGNDSLDGGDGNDVLQGGSSDAGTWQFRLTADGQLSANFTGSDLALGDSFQATGCWTGSTTVDPRIDFVRHEHGTLSDISLLYHAILGRLPDTASLNEIANLQLTPRVLAQFAYDYFVQDPAIRSHSLDGQVHALVERVWGNGSTTQDIVDVGVAYFTQGGNWADALLTLARHASHTDGLTNAQGLRQLTTDLVTGEAGWSADAGNDQLFGGAGNDRLIGGRGDNLLDGGEGFDLVEFVGRADDYSVALEETAPGTIDLVFRNELSGDSNILRNVELAKFGGVFYTPLVGVPDPQLNDFKPLTDFVQVVGGADLQAMGVPAGWLG